MNNNLSSCYSSVVIEVTKFLVFAQYAEEVEA